MSWDDAAQQELDHIRVVIFQMEHLGISRRPERTNTVLRPEYWRTRIRAVLTLPVTPGHIEKQCTALLARLDRITAAPRNGAGHDGG